MSPSVDPAYPEPVLEAQGVTKHFVASDRLGNRQTVRAVENATLRLYPGRILALVGESGSGKTTLAKLLALFYPVTSGAIKVHGEPVDSQHQQQDFRRTVQMILQDPFASLNSLHRTRYLLRRPLQLHGHATSRREAERQSLELLERVNLTPADEILEAYPHQLSGGQRQRLSIARALAVRPRVLLADEPISMLDVSIRLDILNLLAKLRDDEQLAMLYITHDIASARYIADTIQVMYAGQTVEGGPSEAVIQRPKHPYTQLLLDSSPDPERVASLTDTAFDDVSEGGEPPDLAQPPTGCRFHPRCGYRQPECATTFPERTTFADGTWTHCWLHHTRTDHKGGTQKSPD